MDDRWRAVLATSGGAGPLAARVAAGTVFVAFSVGKFTRHAAEAEAFERYGIPAPGAAAYAVGALELLGGLALIAGIMTRGVALLLAINMAGAIATAGRIEGGPVHLGLAPALLVVMLGLVWAGAGALSADGRIARPG
jgi:putative oxidoreductase